jgi:hypothetical protein
LLTDLDTYARFLFYGEQVGVHFDVQDIDSLHYEAMIDPLVLERNTDFDYLVIDFQHLEKYLWAGNWDTFEPLSMHLDEIEGNQGLSRIYDNGQIVVYEVANP